jgi:ribosomal protein L37AE/L43A
MMNQDECVTKVESVCPKCKVEIFAIEIASNECDKCGSSLEGRIENVSVTVNPLPIFATMF